MKKSKSKNIKKNIKNNSSEEELSETSNKSSNQEFDESSKSYCDDQDSNDGTIKESSELTESSKSSESSELSESSKSSESYKQPKKKTIANKKINVKSVKTKITPQKKKSAKARARTTVKKNT